jgi:hypothetical protein
MKMLPAAAVGQLGQGLRHKSAKGMEMIATSRIGRKGLLQPHLDVTNICRTAMLGQPPARQTTPVSAQ